MSSWTPKQALSRLISRFRQSDSGESSSYSSADDETEEEDELPVSPLAMMDEKSPEAWLGNFLAILGVAGSARYSTIVGTRRDETLRQQLSTIAAAAGSARPMRLFEPGYASTLKAQSWAGWWQLEGELGRYCYAVLSLALLGDKAHMPDVAAMYRQHSNARIQKDAHYVLCYLLGKSWPGYNVTEGDLDRLASGQNKEGK